jgi:hypothetical protein
MNSVEMPIMAESQYDIVLSQARLLSPEDQQRLIVALSEQPPRTDSSQPRSLYDALMARGLIGFMKDAPPDPSTNPKYMEGFEQSSLPESDDS